MYKRSLYFLQITLRMRLNDIFINLHTLYQNNFIKQHLSKSLFLFQYICKIHSKFQPNIHMNTNNIDIPVKILASTYRLGKKIDQGAFGKIYKGISIKGNNAQYAVKMQSMRAEHPQLILQCKFYSMLHSDSSVCDKGIPNVYHCGTQDEYNYLVMDLMGPSLQNLLGQNCRKFSLKTVLMLFDQMLTNIEYLHSRNILHRDIKPDNFCMGHQKNKHRLYILDFGLAKKYILSNGRHIPYKQGKSLTGTARYASINTHKGVQQACRDDMQSIGYVALYCLKGSLPWQGQKGGNKHDKYQRIKQTKINTTVDSLCKGCPQQFARYLNIVKKLQFEERPNYIELKRIFKDLFAKNGYKFDNEYDWTKVKQMPKDIQKIMKLIK